MELKPLPGPSDPGLFLRIESIFARIVPGLDAPEILLRLGLATAGVDVWASAGFGRRRLLALVTILTGAVV